ncbi:MAG TPA: cobalt-precorrin-5B (C(1))-methyltransferase CbiD [Clostridia bacterium]|nr:cobalt-precorrin-5B (C(1))-methyltransferase CbiD [Clostridia bacterium]
MDDIFVIKDGKRLRCGYTTGSCAAAAAKAAAKMLITREEIRLIDIDTPSGIRLELPVGKPDIGECSASCCIVKDAGDDPDVTDKIEIYARVSRRTDGVINITGGEGIGIITRRGFWGEVGQAAINPVPRKMIREELAGLSGEGFDVVIYAPEGRERARRTFNENIGIEGGISIIGTSGIVEPMSEEALKKTIYLEVDRAYEDGAAELVLFPGNYGEKLVKDLKLEGRGIKISNFIGDTLLYINEKGFRKLTLAGHIGKLCKLSIGAFNTHSRVCDVRIEAFVYYLALEGAPASLLEEVNRCRTSEEAVRLIIEAGYREIFGAMTRGCEDRIRRYLKNDGLNVRVIMYSMDYGVLGGSDEQTCRHGAGKPEVCDNGGC